MVFKNQKDLFNHIWETREHKSELTGLALLPKGHFQWHWQFLHVLPKGTYPNYKFLEKNIILALPEEHAKQETFLRFRELQQELRKEYYKEFYNKEYD